MSETEKQEGVTGNFEGGIEGGGDQLEVKQCTVDQAASMAVDPETEESQKIGTPIDPADPK